MSVINELDARMKENYEFVSNYKLTKRTPVAIRIDGRAFHTFTRKFKKPFDPVFHQSMVDTMEFLCENIQNVKFGYTESDEITLILIDYQTLTTSAFFDYRVQKLASVCASMATMRFAQVFQKNANHFILGRENDEEACNQYDIYCSAINKGAMFDCRCFNVPKEEVCNLILSRQNDATRNSIQSFGQAYFSHKELDKKSCNDIQNMLMEQKNINWNDLPTQFKRGVAWTKERGVDYNMPILTGANRPYVNDAILYTEV